MEDKNIFEKTSDIQDTVTKKTRNFVKTFLIYIVFTALIVVTILLSFVSPELIDRWTRTAIVNALWIFLASTTALVIFFGQGEENERDKNESYKQNCSAWGVKSEEIRKNGKIALLRGFCKNKTFQIRNDVKEYFIRDCAGIDIEEYEKHYADKSIKQIKNDISLSSKQKKFLIKAKKYIDVKPINYMYVLSGTELGQKQSVGQKKKINRKTKILSRKFVTTILNTVIFSSMMLMPNGATTWETVGLCAIRILSILIASISGFYGGATKIREDNSEIKANIVFLDEFTEANI